MSVSSWQTETKFNRRDALVALAVALLASVRSCCSMPPSANAVMTSVLHWVCTVTTSP